MYAIETERLTKVYNGCRVVDQVSLRVRKGEIYGFLGLNGAGKTTTIRMLLGMIKPEYGSIQIMGRTVTTGKGPWGQIGYMVENPGHYPELTVLENLHVFYRLRNLLERSLIDKCTDRLGLSRYKNTKARHLSLGNAQRLGIAKAMLHRPDVLILDEPINGLDPSGIVEIRELLKDLAINDGTTVFISSHILNEVTKLASQIGIIHNGKLLAELDEKGLADMLYKKLVIDTIDNIKALRVLHTSGISAHINGRRQIEITDSHVLVATEEIAVLLVDEGVAPKIMVVEEEDLETYFLKITNGK